MGKQLNRGERYMKLREETVNLEDKYSELIITRVKDGGDPAKTKIAVMEALQHFLFEVALAQADIYNQEDI